MILLTEIEHPRDAARVAEKLIQAISEPIPAGGHALRITVSIGIAIYPDDGEDADRVMRNADAAMYRVKEKGRDNYQFFDGRANPSGSDPTP